MAIGVEVSTSLRTGPTNPGAVSGRLQIAGITERGSSTESVLVKSLAQYESLYGTRQAYASNMYDSARTFFEEGGSELVVSRAVGPAATSGFLVLKSTAGTVDTLRVAARNPGAHSSAITVEVTVSGGLYTITVRRSSEVIGLFANLTTPADAVAAASSNPHVVITDMGDATAAPGNQPKALVPTVLSAGIDDRAAVTSTIVAAALNNPGPITRGAAVAAPGYAASAIGAALIAHAKANSKIALLSPASGANASAAAAEAKALVGADGAYAGVFYPHIVIPDGNGTRTLSPEAYVGAVRARSHVNIGFWAVPAGERALPRWIVGTVATIDRPTNNTLADSQLNGIVTVGGKPRLYGWASLATDRDNLGLLSAQDSLNSLAVQVEDLLEEFVFSTIDGRGILLSRVESAVVGLLDPIAQANGFYPKKVGDEIVDPGYRVTADETINTATSIANNEVRVSLSVRLAPTAALLKAEIIKVALSAAV
ncbi:tail sheath protein [Arthrobacter phage Colucci]|uniref:Tail sheath protein n=1 Tax=Arthrobacter phage Colucci TaxID=2015834 RepID=A0A286N2T1_9CAUD|nr:tail sheath protein [Arthrobacter phage Colucci]ASX98688.1 tail sheath protein [Arthrobacter phage Colucci]